MSSLLRYIIIRFLLSIPTLLLVLFLTFLLAKSLPGDPITVMFGELQPPPEVRAELERKLGLDQPVYIQFLRFVVKMATLDWGKSIHTREPVLELAIDRFLATLQLALASIALASILGLSLAYVSVLRYGGLIDRMIRVVSIASYSIPVFWWGIILILVFSVYLQILPPGGRGGVEHLVLPTLTLATINFGMIARVSRASMLEVALQDYVSAARAKGLSEQTVVARYILRNALIPITTLVGLRFGILMGGAVITETVFAYPGIGKMIIDAIFARDYPVIIGGIFMAAVSILVINIIVDIIYSLLDPRVKTGR